MPNYAAIMTARTAQAALSDADFIAWGQATTKVLPPVAMITYGIVRTVSGREKADVIQGLLDASDPNAGRMFIGNGVDAKLPEVQAMLATIVEVTKGQFTADDIQAVQDFISITRPAPSAFWGLNSATFDAQALAGAVAWQAAQDALARNAAEIDALDKAIRQTTTKANQAIFALRASVKAGTPVKVPTLVEVLAL